MLNVGVHLHIALPTMGLWSMLLSGREREAAFYGMPAPRPLASGTAVHASQPSLHTVLRSARFAACHVAVRGERPSQPASVHVGPLWHKWHGSRPLAGSPAAGDPLLYPPAQSCRPRNQVMSQKFWN